MAASVRAAPGTEVETGEKGVVEEALAGMEVVTVVEENILCEGRRKRLM